MTFILSKGCYMPNITVTLTYKLYKQNSQVPDQPMEEQELYKKSKIFIQRKNIKNFKKKIKTKQIITYYNHTINTSHLLYVNGK